MTPANEIKGLAESAIRMLDDGSWKPIDGGIWSAMTGAVVTLNKPSWFSGASYTVICPRLGKWTGRLNGASCRGVGKPSQVYTADQVAELRALQARSADEHAAEIAKALQS